MKSHAGPCCMVRTISQLQHSLLRLLVTSQSRGQMDPIAGVVAPGVIKVDGQPPHFQKAYRADPAPGDCQSDQAESSLFQFTPECPTAFGEESPPSVRLASASRKCVIVCKLGQNPPGKLVTCSPNTRRRQRAARRAPWANAPGITSTHPIRKRLS